MSRPGPVERWERIAKDWQGRMAGELPGDAGIVAALLVIAELLESIDQTLSNWPHPPDPLDE